MEFEIKAVHESDLIQYLESLGIYKGIKNGEYICKHCESVITIENFLCVYPYDSKIEICCDNPKCYVLALNEMQEDAKSD